MLMEYILFIKEIRIKQGLTQSQLARKSNVKQSYISQLERNIPNAKSPTLRIMFQISEALGICPHFLVQYKINCNDNCFYICKGKFF